MVANFQNLLLFSPLRNFLLALLNLSNWAISAAWQQWRDEASWVNTAAENDQNRNHNLAMAALERSTAVDLQDQASKDSMYQMIGKFGFDFLSNITKK